MRVLLAVALLVVATAAMAAGTTTTYKHPTIPKHSVTRVTSTAGALGAGVDQVHKMFIFFTNHCKNQFNKTSDQIFNGGYEVPPPAIIPSTGGMNMGMEAGATPGRDHINGTLTYQSAQYGFAAGYFCVDGEWGFEISYPTELGVLIMGAEIGKTQVYDVNVGFSSAPFDMSC